MNTARRIVATIVSLLCMAHFAPGAPVLVGPIVDTTLAETGSILMVGIVLVSALFMIVGGKVGRTKAFILFFLWVASVIALSGGEGAETAAGALGL